VEVAELSEDRLSMLDPLEKLQPEPEAEPEIFLAVAATFRWLHFRPLKTS
jgi:hypothetical protein